LVRVGDYPVEHHPKERIAPRKIESRRTPAQIELSLDATGFESKRPGEFYAALRQLTPLPVQR
jgi:hypothetical protein